MHRRHYRSSEIVCIEAKLLVRVLLSDRFMGIRRLHDARNESWFRRYTGGVHRVGSRSVRPPKSPTWVQRVIVGVSITAVQSQYVPMKNNWMACLLTSSPINSDASWHDFVEACLTESGAEVTGECTAWASGNNYGTMRVDTSFGGRYENGYDTVNFVSQGFRSKVLSTAIFQWNTEKVFDMGSMFFLLHSWTLGVEHKRQSDLTSDI